MFDWRMQEIRHCRTREFSTRIMSREEVAVLERFRRTGSFSWFFENDARWTREEQNAYDWMVPYEELDGRNEALERLEWSGAVIKAGDGWHLTAKGRHMHAKLAREGKFSKRKSRSKPVRTGCHEKKLKGPKTLQAE